MRQELRAWLRRLHDEIHTTSVFVTHDQEEAFEVADEVVVMNQGRIEQRGTPQQIFDHPANAFVMDFLGNVNVFHGRVQDGRAVLGKMSLAYPDYPHQEARPATLYVRPHELEIHRSADEPNCVEARVQRINPTGSMIKIGLVSPEHNANINVDLTTVRYAELQLKTGDIVWVSPKHVRVFVPEGADYVI